MFTQHQVAKILVAENQSLWQELSFFKFQFVRRTKDFVQIENQGLGKEDTGLPTKDDTSKMIVRNLASNIIEIQRIEIARYSNIRWISLHSDKLQIGQTLNSNLRVCEVGKTSHVHDHFFNNFQLH